ncbi:hypothetical protein [Marinilactibacillus kalidii]|uniref:hypothetical protein n=1 Tax=Marinilactibacillus kalidii TaxID=2820274 RepID=UPI001ABECCCB|nr:hypothetical protein [Marinilactibacillus kalidii]
MSKEYVTKKELKEFIELKIQQLKYLIDNIQPMPIKMIIVNGKIEKYYSYKENTEILSFHEKIRSLKELISTIEKEETSDRYYSQER